MTGLLDSILPNDVAVTLLVTGVALLAVWVPFYRGLKLCLQGLAATRRLGRDELERRLRSGSSPPVEPVALRMLRVLGKSLRESQPDQHPTEFVVDASRQYVTNEYEANYARPISMYANILPPIGFIGTTGGLLILFLSMRIASDSLELGALAMALTSSIFALVGFAVLEGLKIRLYGRMLAGLDEALAFYQAARARERKAA
jgi:hypothetical protein